MRRWLLGAAALSLACSGADAGDSDWQEPAASGGATTGGIGGATGGSATGGTTSGGTANGGTTTGGTATGGFGGAVTGGTSPGGSNGTGGAVTGGAGAGGTTGGTAPGGAGGSPSNASFSIAFEYDFDTAGYFDAPRRALLDAAADAWSRYLASEFEDIPAGTALRTRHPEHVDLEGMVFTVDYPVDDLLILLGSQALDGPGNALASSSSSFTNQVMDTDLLERLRTRYESNPFQPWVAQTTFDTEEGWTLDATPDTDDDLPPDGNDFLSTAIHEIGHVLGVGSAAAWEALVEDGAFVGPRAMEVHGGPVPLAPDGVHFAQNTQSNGKLPSMEYGTAPGQRKRPTALDLAVLEDLGYAIRWELVD